MSFLDHIYPRFCLGCGKFGTYCCGICLQKIPSLQFLKCPVCGQPSIDGLAHIRCQKRYGIDGLLSMYPYAGIVQRAIKQIKYRFAYQVIGDLLQNLHPDSFMRWKKNMGKNAICIVPIPLHTTRRNYRGFNQSEIIANFIGKRFAIPVEKKILFRRRKTVPQVDMKNRNERLSNMKDTFAVSDIRALRNYSVVLLIDDVFTTGATMRSAASVLKRNGIQTVWGLTIAQ